MSCVNGGVHMAVLVKLRQEVSQTSLADVVLPQGVEHGRVVAHQPSLAADCVLCEIVEHAQTLSVVLSRGLLPPPLCELCNPVCRGFTWAHSALRVIKVRSGKIGMDGGSRRCTVARVGQSGRHRVRGARSEFGPRKLTRSQTMC